MKHKPTCRCVECDITAYLGLYRNKSTAWVTIAQLKKWRSDYRKAMRLLERHVEQNEIPAIISDERQLNAEIREMVAKWREGQ